MEDKKEPNQSRTSEIQILELRKDMDLCRAKINKDLDHSQYKLDDLEKEFEFIKTHFSGKNKEICDKIQRVNTRIDAHISTETEFHQRIHQEILDKFAKLDVRMSSLEKWKAVIYGGIISIAAMVGYILQSGINLK